MKEVQNWIISSFNADENTSATIVISISIFIIGMTFQLFIARIRKFWLKSIHRKAFKEVLNSITKTVIVQSKNFKKTSDSFKMESYGSFYLKRKVIVHLDSFEEFDFIRVYESFSHFPRWA